jgi:hypothetical protein
VGTGALDLGEVERIKIQMREHRSGSGSPEGVLDGSLYETYSDQDTSPETAYVKLIDGGNTGWTAAGGGGGFELFEWEGAVSKEQFWRQMGTFVYDQSDALAGVTSLTCHHTNILEGVYFENTPDIESISFPELVSIDSNSDGLYFQNNLALATIALPLLEGGSLAVQTNANLVNFSIPSWNTSVGNLQFAGNAFSEASVNAIIDSLVSAGFTGILNITGGTNASPTGSSLTGVSTLLQGGAQIAFKVPSIWNMLASSLSSAFEGLSSDTLTALSAPNLLTLSGTFLLDCPNIESISFPVCTSIGGRLGLALSASNVVNFSFPALATVGENVELTAGLFSALDLPALTSIGGAIILILPNLTSVDLSSLVSVGSVILFSDSNECPLLADIDLSSFVPSNGSTFKCVGASLTQATVDQILARYVASGVTSGQINLSGGSSSAPSVAGAADKATLIGRGLTVMTN